MTTEHESNDALMEVTARPSLTTTPPSSNRSPQAVNDSLPGLQTTAYQSHRQRLIFVVAAQILALSCLAGAHAYTLITGTEVILRTVPVDPWDMFRGSYVSLGYDISVMRYAKQLKNDQQVFVVLERVGANWRTVGLEESRPRLSANEVCICGKVTAYSGGKAFIHYGIEQYYVPSELASNIERQHPRVLLAVDSMGNAAIKKLLPN